MQHIFRAFFRPAIASKREVAIMYFGSASDYLMMTSERMGMPDGKFSIEQMLTRLRTRGARWAYELDDSYVVCTVNGEPALMSDCIEAGDEIGIFSHRSPYGV